METVSSFLVFVGELTDQVKLWGFIWCWSEQTVQQGVEHTVELTVISDATMLMCLQYGVKISSVIWRTFYLGFNVSKGHSTRLYDRLTIFLIATFKSVAVSPGGRANPCTCATGMHGCVFITVATDALLLKHQAIGIISADSILNYWTFFSPKNIASTVSNTGKWNLILTKNDPVVLYHYSDVIMTAMASQITSITIVYSTVYSGADQRKHQSSASLAFVWGIHRWPVNSPHKWPVTLKTFPFDDVIMHDLQVICHILTQRSQCYTSNGC